MVYESHPRIGWSVLDDERTINIKSSVARVWRSPFLHMQYRLLISTSPASELYHTLAFHLLGMGVLLKC